MTKWNELGVDGWRLDVADELPDDFLREIRHNLDRCDDRILIGEVWEDASSKVSYGHRRPYVSGDNLYGTMNYPLRQWVISLLNGHCDLIKAGEDLLTLVENYPRNFLLVCPSRCPLPSLLSFLPVVAVHANVSVMYYDIYCMLLCCCSCYCYSAFLYFCFLLLCLLFCLEKFLVVRLV